MYVSNDDFNTLIGAKMVFHFVVPIGDHGGKQWQPTPKKVPRMQCARAISVAWLGSSSC